MTILKCPPPRRPSGLLSYSYSYSYSYAVDQRLDPSLQCHVAGGVEHPEIAGAAPAVGERGGVRLRIVLVAVRDVRTLDHHLALRARRQQRSEIVHDPDPDPGPQTDRA